jgi:Ser/Thr protein kinase RdoA (MazF antagonist)
MIDTHFISAVERMIGTPVATEAELDGGDEARTVRLSSRRGTFVLRIEPPWRTRRELEWVHAVATQAHGAVPQAVAPIQSNDGGTVLVWRERCASLFPFVDGIPLDREDRALRAEAARVLAAVHLALLSWRGSSRPGSIGPRRAELTDIAELEDPELDERWRSIRDAGAIVGPTHGDYYPGNVLCRGGGLVGVIDWCEADVRPLALELGGASFEFCRNDDHELDPERTREFVHSYVAAGGPVPPGEIRMLPVFIRWWVRQDALTSFAWNGKAGNTYAWKQVAAFDRLRNLTLDLS